ncbi:APC family permease [Ochrobactrum sp. SFR4]|uniref:APC family permease n=1 Tax=Ochrobactrum sp. SFR4 TaxID=2717368 RepID=UPI001C8C73E7|nr:APC family permease [Ochrobactrum sp. SFR4]MBX8827350.1 APC family permease [Ochrobactrum sp. SFR4]
MSKSSDDSSLAKTEFQGGQDAFYRGIGTVDIVFMVVAAVAPLGAAAIVVPTVFAQSGSIASPLYFIAAAAILCLFSVGFTLMSRYIQNAGAFYTYIQAGLGKMMGSGAASLALVSYLILMIGLYAYIGVASAAAASTYLSLIIPWWIWSFAFIGIVAFLGYRDIELSAKVLGVVLVLEVLAIFIVNFAIIFHGGAEGLSTAPLNVEKTMSGAPGLGLLFAFYAFLGFETIAVFRSEARDPDRAIPRATYAAVIFMGGLYAFSAWSQAVGIGVSKFLEIASADPAVVLPNLASQYVGTTMKDLIEVLLVTSFFACVLSFHNVVARYQFTLARGGLLPRALGTVHESHRSPSLSSLTVTVISFTILGALTVARLDPVTDIYTWFSGSATLGLVVLMTLTSLSVVVFHQREKMKDSIWSATVAPILSLIGLCTVLYLMVQNLEMLVGGRIAATCVLIATGLAFALGVSWAAMVKRRKPRDYAQMLE